MIKCAVFDADGTLLDSMPMWREITYIYPEKFGIKAPEGLHRTMNRLSMEQCAEHYIGMGVPGPKERVMKDLAGLALKGYSESVPEKPGAAEFLGLLHRAGIKIAMATASHSQSVQTALKRLNMLSYIDFAVSCTDVGKGKQEPDVFLRCAEELGARPCECVVFEDSAYAIKTAKKAGFPVVAILDPISTDGLGEDESTEGIKKMADRSVYDFTGLIEELRCEDEQ